jgi:hypothetical protein
MTLPLAVNWFGWIMYGVGATVVIGWFITAMIRGRKEK